MKYTIFGGRGFIGSQFVEELTALGHDVYVPQRNDDEIYIKSLGTIIYCAGFGDCNKDPFNVFEANVSLLKAVLEKSDFDKLVYISSTRVCMNQDRTTEDSDLKITYDDGRKLFNLTKLVAEELCLKSNRKCLIIRPSNVYGLAINSNLFLPSIIRDAINDSVINMYVPPSYEKDYVSVTDVVNVTIQLIEKNIESSIINIASGYNTKAQEIVDVIKGKTGCKVNWLSDNFNCSENFSQIDISKMKSLAKVEPRNVLADIGQMIRDYEIKIISEK